MASVLRAYNAVLQRRPMTSQCLTSAALFGASDVVAQQLIENRGRKHDFVRTLRATFYGGAMFGPLVVKWYQFLNRLQFATPRRAIVYRTYLDQSLFAPGIVAFYFGSMTALEGKGPGDAWDRLEKAYVPTLWRNWLVFVPMQVINFWLVPHHMRVVFSGGVAFFWNTYLSLANTWSKDHSPSPSPSPAALLEAGGARIGVEGAEAGVD